MAVRGQRFHVDLDVDDESPQQQVGHGQTSSRTPWSLVTDIHERSPSAAPKPPSPSRLRSSQGGFPAHTNRTRSSTFRQRKAGSNPKLGSSVPSVTDTGVSRLAGSAPNQKQEIELENRRKIATMSTEAIANAQQEIRASLDPPLIERLLKRANIEEDQDADEPIEKTASSKKSMGTTPSEPSLERFAPSLDPEDVQIKAPPDLQPVSTFMGYPAPPSFHFPHPPTPPDLDPEDPEFLSKLHSTYFPSLPTNPNALSWMKPPSPGESEAYSPSRDDLHPSAVRFDFRGRLLPPRLASQIPVTKGLHHHGIAPEAAGYTIPELSHLSRSSIPSQRCIAYQTLGRILYRLGSGVFGPEDHELCQGLWQCIRQGRVLDTLTAEAARDGDSGNRSCWVTATEAMWLWRKGGGRRWKAA
ncbi:MAG: hypothetical protein LQ350_000619 [Teloschistes chrysophthalmus]|nr:MAG: hypothetical protein LQ350_000619 [Niorma chrysophthalma]